MACPGTRRDAHVLVTTLSALLLLGHTPSSAFLRQLLDASLQQLRDMLQQQGVELTGVSVEADAQGGAQQQAQHPRMPWDTAAVQHAQVAVPVEGAAAQRPVAAQGLSLYA